MLKHLINLYNWYYTDISKFAPKTLFIIENNIII